VVPFTIISIILFTKMKKSEQKRNGIVLLAVLFYLLFEILYQLVVFLHWHQLTVGSDEQRYFETASFIGLEFSEIFVPRETSNIIYYLINHLYIITSPNLTIAILLIRISNAFIYVLSYIYIVEIINTSDNFKVKSIVKYDILFLFFPLSIYMFSRNVRESYILVLILLNMKYFLFLTRKRTFKNIIFYIISLISLGIFRFGFLIILFCSSWFPYLLMFKKNQKFLKISILLIFIFSGIVLINSNYFTNSLNVLLMLGDNQDLSAQEILSLDFYGKIKELVIKTIKNFPYFILEPSLFNTFIFNFKNDLSIFYSLVDHVIIFLGTIVNHFIVYPLALITGIKYFKNKNKSLFSTIILVTALIISVIYSAAIGGTDIRTKALFFSLIIIFIWSEFLHNYQKFSLISILNANILVSTLMIYTAFIY